MQALRTHVAGVDVHKEILAIAILIGGGDEEPRVEHLECSTFTDDLRACGVVLLEKGIREVLMESTGVYWKPVYNVWAPMGINCVVGNARHMKNVPGRKTDMNDAHWAATLHRFGLVRPSFIPDGEFQRMRLWTRHRTNLVNDLARVKNRIQKVLEDGNIKWGSIVSDVFGVSGFRILELISDGVTNPNTLAASIDTKIKRREEALKALTNCFTTDHCNMIKELMNQYRDLKTRIEEADRELCEKAKPHAELISKLDAIPGIDVGTAITIIAESGTNMSKFRDERSYAAWAGVAAGNNESAGKKKRSKCRIGNPSLRKCLIQAAFAATKKRGSFYRSKYNSLRYRLGSANKAKVAIANRLARTLYKVMGGATYKDLGYMRGDPQEKIIEKYIRKLRAMGVDIHTQNHQTIVGVRKVKVENTGIVLDEAVASGVPFRSSRP